MGLGQSESGSYDPDMMVRMMKAHGKAKGIGFVVEGLLRFVVLDVFVAGFVDGFMEIVTPYF
ncbi:transmembrane protein, putative [Medicago truncatula]|uniref:Transmembrane protein, putative n=1 Tax=Medicago truncatula TaxID=3880 RepID=G7IQJ1_MEDTR|nr:transmembrane protein, putative [Medicago truncatula]